MNSRSLFTGVCAVVCLGTITGVMVQGSQITGLRAEQHRLATQLETAYDASDTAPAESARQAASRAGYSPSPELLQLRSQINRLTTRKRELGGATNENERLRAQLAARATNAIKLPPGYLRRTEARMVGYNTPEATIETFLWAIQNRDFANVLRTLTPDSAQRLQAQTEQGSRSVEDFFHQWMLPGLHILERQQQKDGSIRLNVEVIPGSHESDTIRFRQVTGQWKMDQF